MREFTRRQVSVSVEARVNVKTPSGMRIQHKKFDGGMRPEVDFTIYATGDEQLNEYLHVLRDRIDVVIEELEREGKANDE